MRIGRCCADDTVEAIVLWLRDGGDEPWGEWDEEKKTYPKNEVMPLYRKIAGQIERKWGSPPDKSEEP